MRWPPKPPPLPVIVEVDEPVPEAAPVAVDAGDIKSKMTGAIAGMATVRKTKPTEKAPPKVDLPKVRQKEPFLKKKKTIFYLSGSTTCCRCRLARRKEKEGSCKAAREAERHATGHARLQVPGQGGDLTHLSAINLQGAGERGCFRLAG